MAQQDYIQASSNLNNSDNSEKYLERTCPCCGTVADEFPEVETKLDAKKLSLKALTSQWNGFFKDKSIFPYNRCKACGLLFAPTFFTADQLSSLYAQMPPNMDEVPQSALRQTQYGYFKALKAHSSLNGSFIEMGPDIGLFVENCVREGNFDQYWLLEPNRVVETELRQVVDNYKHNIVHDMPGFSKIPNNSVSAAVMIHVLDHLLDPIDTLKQLRATLKRDSKIIIVTHDESSLLRKLTGKRWPAFCLQHPQIYNPHTMRNMLKRAGFDVLEQHKTINYFEIKFLIKHLLWAVGFRIKKVPSFGNAIVGLKLGNMLTIAMPTQNGEVNE